MMTGLLHHEQHEPCCVHGYLNHGCCEAAAQASLRAENGRLREALQTIANRGLVNDSEDVRLWTREWTEQFRDLLNNGWTAQC